MDFLERVRELSFKVEESWRRVKYRTSCRLPTSTVPPDGATPKMGISIVIEYEGNI
jgi:hypothetical protein